MDRVNLVNHQFNIFNGKRVFLTGQTGFKGAWLCVMLEMLGAKTTAYALAPDTSPAIFDLIHGKTLCDSHTGDLRDLDRLTSLIAQTKPDVVLHLAAQSLVRRSYREPIDTFASNIMGTANVLEAMRRYDGSCVGVMITTDKVYAESGKVGYAYVESDKLGGYDPYSTSKAACELVCESYRKSYFHPSDYAKHGKSLATARAGNVIGGGDWCEDRLVPDIARALSRGEKIRVRNPSAVRPWQHVIEPLTGYLTLAAKMLESPTQFCDAYNFGPENSDVLTVKQLVELAIECWGHGSYYEDVDPNAPHEAGFLQIDSSKAKRDLNWHPKLDARTAVANTIDWYRHAGEDALGYTRKQIEAYLSR